MIIDQDAYLEHYGVKGMKWGVRKGKKSTGVSRRRGAQIQRNEQVIRNIKAAQRGEKYKISVAIGKKFLGEKKQRENQNKYMKDLRDQNKRIKSGQLTVSDRLVIAGQTNVFDLMVTRTPSK